jgi:anaerobic selenocysteine-containing dehydrogenase
VLQLMKKHYSRYTPEMVAKVCGTPKESFVKICEMMAETAAPDKTMTILYALGWTQHSHGSQNIRTMAMIQLLLGNMGMAGGGINALRGHANVQGITDMCLFGASVPGYMGAPTDKEPDFKTYIEKRTPKMLRPNQMNYWQNYSKFFVSLMKSWYGNAATKENDFAYDWMPKIDGAYDTLALFEKMHQGKINGFVCQGFNPLASVSNKKKVGDALAKLKFLVVIDPLATDTSEFWKPHGEFNEVDPAKVPPRCSACRPRCSPNRQAVTPTPVASSSGTGRRQMVRARPRMTPKSWRCYSSSCARCMPRTGASFRMPIKGLAWPYRIPTKPSPEELAMESTARRWPTSSIPRTRPR